MPGWSFSLTLSSPPSFSFFRLVTLVQLVVVVMVVIWWAGLSVGLVVARHFFVCADVH